MKCDFSKRSIRWTQKSDLETFYFGNNLHYCFIDEDYCQASYFLMCRSALQLSLMAHILNESISALGVSYKVQTNCFCTKTTRMALTSEKESFYNDVVEGLIPFLNQLEDYYGIERTVFSLCSNPPKRAKCVFIIDGSAKWIHAPPLFSLYTLLIRYGMLYKGSIKKLNVIDDLFCVDTDEKSPLYDVYAIDNYLETIKFLLQHDEKELFYKTMRDNYNYDDKLMFKFGLTEYHNCCVRRKFVHKEKVVNYWAEQALNFI